MGAHQSKEELVYHQVSYGNIEGIKALRREGAGLEWVDKEGKTPLILACMRADLLAVAKVLIVLGANVNAYRAGCHAGTPLHHATKRGLEQTVNLLLSSNANPLATNDGCQTPLDLARAKGHGNVVRAIEKRVCLFSGWLREIHGPSILEAFAPQWVTRKIWAVVLPSDSRNPRNPCKLNLAIYSDVQQVAKPRLVIAIGEVHIEDPKFNQHDPALVIVDKTSKARYKFLSAYEADKQQMQWFYNACRGICHQNSYPPVAPVRATPTTTSLANQQHLDEHEFATSSTAPPDVEDIHLAMAINASIQTAIAEGVPITNATTTGGREASSENFIDNGPPKPKVDPSLDPYNNRWSGVRPSSSGPQLHMSRPEAVTFTPSAQEAPPNASVPSAPPIIEDTFCDGPNEGSSSSSSSCVICLDSRVEGACIPCGHMAGCMSCLNEIKAQNWGCPICRAKIDQVVRLYSV